MNVILEKCPRCDLNYIKPGEKYCKVCMREIKGNKLEEEVELCSVCNENQALPGKDACFFCLKEIEKNPSSREDEDGDDKEEGNSLEIDSVSSMDEMIPQLHDDIPEREFGEIENELSLESVREEEDFFDEEEEEEF